MRSILAQNSTKALTLALFAGALVAHSARAQWVTWEVSAGGNGHEYQAVPGFPGLTWSLANQLAQQAGGYLATVTSPEENAFVFSLVNNAAFFTGYNGSGPALGGFQPDGAPEPDGGWSWVTGESWNYANWWPSQPDNFTLYGGEDRLAYFSGTGSTPAPTWNDLYRDDSNIGGYVVEVVPEPASVALLSIGLLLWRSRRTTQNELPSSPQPV
jgi:hypothetical protein